MVFGGKQESGKCWFRLILFSHDQHTGRPIHFHREIKAHRITKEEIDKVERDNEALLINYYKFYK